VKYFIIYVSIIFVGLLGALAFKQSQEAKKSEIPTLRVYASSSFIAQWGPGPWLKQAFEKNCNCHVEYFDGADSTLLLQRLKSDVDGGVDVALSFDQFDLEHAENITEWKHIDIPINNFVDRVKEKAKESELVPYEWGVMAFVARNSEIKELPKSVDDFLRPEWKSQVVIEDPRTSSPGAQFLFWLIALKGEDAAFDFLKKLNNQVHSYPPNWSSAYGLFQKGQVKSVFSYVTSPIYHKVEEKNNDYVALDFADGHPMQIEYLGIPEKCRQCDLANQFVNFIFTKEGQKIIMEKNYMFPVLKGVKEGTLFAQIPEYKTIEIPLPKLAERERLLKKWAQTRRAD
jgi:thiamine transport system substrate-binding protein